MFARMARRHAGAVARVRQVQLRWSGSGDLTAEEKKHNLEEYNRLKAESEERQEEGKDRDASVKLLQMGLVALSAPLAYWWFQRQHERAAATQSGQKAIMVSEVKKTGEAAVGGDWTLVRTDGVPVTSAEYLGTYPIMYFGFTHCPEICPVELNKMSRVVDEMRRRFPGRKFMPLFVSCDPRRDSLKEVASYLKDFHPDFVGLVGTHEQTRKMCKEHRIYYSSPSPLEEDEGDYLVDHSIAMYFFDDRFKFMDIFGSRFSAEEIADVMTKQFSELPPPRTSV